MERCKQCAAPIVDGSVRKEDQEAIDQGFCGWDCLSINLQIVGLAERFARQEGR